MRMAFIGSSGLFCQRGWNEQEMDFYRLDWDPSVRCCHPLVLCAFVCVVVTIAVSLILI